MCVNTTQRHKLLRGGGCCTSLYPCSAWCCHPRGAIITNRSAHRMLFSALPSPPPPKHTHKKSQLWCVGVWFLFLIFFFCHCKISGWSNNVFTGFERCFLRGNSTTASKTAVYGILSWPLLNILPQVWNILLQEHSSLFLSQEWFHLLLAGSLITFCYLNCPFCQIIFS